MKKVMYVPPKLFEKLFPKKVVEKAGIRLEDIGLIECNEAFAAQFCTVERELEWEPGHEWRWWDVQPGKQPCADEPELQWKPGK